MRDSQSRWSWHGIIQKPMVEIRWTRAIQRIPELEKKKVSIFHGQLGGGNGGSEARAMWAAEALKHEFAVTLITPGPVHLDRLNRFYGTSVASSEVCTQRLPIPRVLEVRQAPSALRGAFGQRALKSLVHDHDVLISTYNF